jgi:anaerobic magnesium-protoporphyrin IX monomethyl ester cyclase
MLSILIGHSYFLRFDQKQFERAKPYPPLATLQAAALLRQAGHRVSLFDAMLADGTQEYDLQLEAVKPQLVLFYEDNFNYLSKMCLGKMRQAACEMIASARLAGCTVIAAGSDASDAPETYLAAGADLVLLGEGLAALLAFIARLHADPSASIPQLVEGLGGIATWSRGEVAVAEGAHLLPTPQQPSLPAWDLIDMNRYREVWQRTHGYFSLNMAASRGCSFRCNWCAKPIWGNRYLQRKAADVAAEMAYLKRTFQPDHVWFADDIFGFRVDWVREFAAAARAVDGIIPFTIQTRADLIGEEMAEALKDAGCSEAWIGAESGSQKILDAMNKGTTLDEILTARSLLKAHDIRVGFFIQIGYLDEQLEDILATRELIDNARPDDIGVSVSYPLPGTKFYEKVKEHLGDKTRWSESNDLAMMFRGTYSSEFYRAVRDLLHEQVNVEKLNGSRANGAYASARSNLQQRWQSLLANAGDHRNAAVVG